MSGATITDLGLPEVSPRVPVRRFSHQIAVGDVLVGGGQVDVLSANDCPLGTGPRRSRGAGVDQLLRSRSCFMSSGNPVSPAVLPDSHHLPM